ncbi:hypothetical protein [Acetobacter sp.]|uniref:hypothetical protein n=1 Tax=Acetobacter sp. TaxID=440 RepID=UPI0039E770B8
MAEAEEFGQAETEDSQTITVDGRYVINLAHKLPDFVKCPTYTARDTMSPAAELLALAPNAFLPVRANAPSFLQVNSPHLMKVRSVNDKTGAVWIICDPPVGIPLSESSGWTEAAVIDRVIVPLARVLHTYHEAGLTHRAIRPDNVFDPGGKATVMLGPGLSAPPAFHQPQRFESLGSAICSPAARGNGTIADDVFSLGALAIWLLKGCDPYQNDAPGALIEERIQKGSFAVFAGTLALSPDVAQLLAAMLSDDPTLRPTPRDLLNAAGHKGFVVRRVPTATAAIMLGSVKIRTTRALVWYAVQYRREFTGLFVRGLIERWLSYELGLTQAATKLSMLPKDAALAEDETQASASLFMEIMAIIEPTMPMVWQGVWLWPDALGQMVTTSLSQTGQSAADTATLVLEVLNKGRLEKFAQQSLLPDEAKACRSTQKTAGQLDMVTAVDVIRLPYMLNPFQACLSPQCAAQRFSTPQALLLWLNTAQTTGASGNTSAILDAHMTNFMIIAAVRARLVDYLADLLTTKNTWSLDLLLLARLQRLYAVGPLGGIGRKLLPHLSSELKKWRSRSERTARGERLASLATAGDLGQMYELLNDKQSLKNDQLACLAAQQERARLEEERSELQHMKIDVLPETQREMISLATSVGVICAIGSLCAEIMF